MRKKRPPKGKIMKLYQKGLTQKEIGEIYGWGQSGISQLMKEYGIPTRTHRKWTPREEEILKKHYLKVPKEKLLKLLPGRSWEAIKLEAIKLGIARKKEEYKKSKEVIERLRKLAQSKMIIPNFKKKEDLAYVLGVLDGDGFTNKKRTLGLETISKEFAEKFTEKLRSIGLNASIKFNKRKKKWTVWASSKVLVKWYLSLSPKKKIKWLINNKVAWNYLEGLYDSDGALHPCGAPQICGTKRSKNEFVSKLLNCLNIENTIHKDKVWIRVSSTKKFFKHVRSVVKHRNPSWLK
jgi:transcriptional regulator with XRE-family HTH domain